MAAFRAIGERLHDPEDVKADFTGRNVIVTGSNCGIGFEAAVKFVQLGAEKVILAVRSSPKGEVARKLIEERAGRDGVVEVWLLDMMDYGSLRAFAQKVNEELDHIDVVVLNAACIAVNFEPSRYGWDRTLQINTLSTALLSLLLLPKLRASKTPEYTPVLLLVSSGTHQHASLSETAREAESPLEVYNVKNRTGLFQYSMSKLFLQYALASMVKRLAASHGDAPPVFIISVCPGPCRSEIARDSTQWYMRAARVVLTPILLKPAEAGARLYISAIALGEKGHGRFWQQDRLREPAPALVGPENEALREKVWREILRILTEKVPEVEKLAQDI